MTHKLLIKGLLCSYEGQACVVVGFVDGSTAVVSHPIYGNDMTSMSVSSQQWARNIDRLEPLAIASKHLLYLGFTQDGKIYRIESLGLKIEQKSAYCWTLTCKNEKIMIADEDIRFMDQVQSIINAIR